MDEAQPDSVSEEPTPETAGPKKRGGLLYKLALASVGGVMLAQEELTKVFKPKGEGDEAAPPADPSSAEAEPLPLESGETAWIDNTINQVLKTLCVASRDEVQALQRDVDALADRLAALRSAR